MERKAKRIKLIISLAVAIIALLLIVITAQIIAINKNRRINQEQQETISRLTAEKEYYENQKNHDGNKDDKNPNSEIILGENQ